MPRAVWTGTLTFGLVTIPVRLFPATEPKDVRFRLMDQLGRRVRYRRVVEWEPPPDIDAGAPPDDEPPPPSPRGESAAAPERPAEDESPGGSEVEYQDLMRGFETGDGGVVLMSQDEIESVRP